MGFHYDMTIEDVNADKNTGDPDCMKYGFDGECSDKCIEDHEICCSLCERVFKDANGNPLCSEICDDEDKRNAGVVIDREEKICIWCAMRIGRVEI